MYKVVTEYSGWFYVAPLDRENAAITARFKRSMHGLRRAMPET